MTASTDVKYLANIYGSKFKWHLDLKGMILKQIEGKEDKFGTGIGPFIKENSTEEEWKKFVEDSKEQLKEIDFLIDLFNRGLITGK